MNKKKARYLKRTLSIIIPWVLARIIVNTLIDLLYLLDPGWLIVALMAIMDEALPPCVGFLSLIHQYYKEAVEDGELDAILGNASDSQHEDSNGYGSSIDPIPTREPEVLPQIEKALDNSTPKPVKCLPTEPPKDPVFVPDASSWNAEISHAELLSLLSKRPYFDCEINRCTAERYDDYQKRFVPLERFVVLDIETTGLSAKDSKIIEIAAVKFEQFQVVDTFATLVNPGVALPKHITDLTGITTTDLIGAPKWENIESEFVDFISDYPLVGHNLIGFDIRFIKQAVKSPIKNLLVDTLKYSKAVFPDFPNHKLSYLKSALNIDVEVSHRALDDVKTTFFLLAACMSANDRPENINTAPHISCTESSFSHYVPPVPERPKRSHHKHIDTNVIVPTCDDIDCGHPLYGKRIVFTGTLSIPREEAMQLAVNHGALLRKTVSGKTNYLIVGKQDSAVVGTDGLSTKQKKAYLLNDTNGANIQIIDEDRFFELVKAKR